MINAFFLFIFLATPAEKCCQNKNVPEECIGFCTPSTAGPLSKNDLVKICNPFWDAILQCRRIVEGMVEFSIANLRSIICLVTQLIIIYDDSMVNAYLQVVSITKLLMGKTVLKMR